MIRSIFNFGKTFASASNAVHRHHIKCSQLAHGLNVNTSNKKFIHTNVILHQKLNASSKKDTVASDDIPIVSITGIKATHDKQYYCAVYWGKNDSMNIFKRHSAANGIEFDAFVEALSIALRQSVFDRKLDKIIIKTNSACLVKNVNIHIKNWRKNGYIKADGTPVKHKEEFRKIDGLLSLINAKVELLPPSPNNYVLDKLKNDPSFGKMIRKHSEIKIKKYNPSTCKSENVIFVSAAKSRGSNAKAGFGIHFKGNDKLNVKSRFTESPISLPRALMFGIIRALNYVKALGLKDAVIVTDNALFLKLFHAEWKTPDETVVKNDHFYNTIKELADELNVSFLFLSPEANNSDFKNAAILAQVALEMSAGN